MNTTTPKPKITISLQELLEKKPPVPELIVAYVIVLADNRMIVGDSYEECYERAKSWIPWFSPSVAVEWYLYSDGNVGYDKREASKTALYAKQTKHYSYPLKAEDIF